MRDDIELLERLTVYQRDNAQAQIDKFREFGAGVFKLGSAFVVAMAALILRDYSVGGPLELRVWLPLGLMVLHIYICCCAFLITTFSPLNGCNCSNGNSKASMAKPEEWLEAEWSSLNEVEKHVLGYREKFAHIAWWIAFAPVWLLFAVLATQCFGP